MTTRMVLPSVASASSRRRSTLPTGLYHRPVDRFERNGTPAK
ncbi:hypothetical protein ACFVBM_02920 [Streptomyces griseus]